MGLIHHGPDVSAPLAGSRDGTDISRYRADSGVGASSSATAQDVVWICLLSAVLYRGMDQTTRRPPALFVPSPDCRPPAAFPRG